MPLLGQGTGCVVTAVSRFTTRACGCLHCTARGRGPAVLVWASCQQGRAAVPPGGVTWHATKPACQACRPWHRVHSHARGGRADRHVGQGHAPRVRKAAPLRQRAIRRHRQLHACKGWALARKLRRQRDACLPTCLPACLPQSSPVLNKPVQGSSSGACPCSIITAARAALACTYWRASFTQPSYSSGEQWWGRIWSTPRPAGVLTRNHWHLCLVDVHVALTQAGSGAAVTAACPA